MVDFKTSPNLDDLLLDIATAIEPSEADRRVIENRYRKLKEYLERPSSPLRPYLVEGESRIYSQGSVPIGATIISGVDDDRFDVDAVVEINVPLDWSNDDALDLLYEALEGFPDAVGIERCTRCVQVQFAFMHMDVTIMDPAQPPRQERIGEIFHSPDSGSSYRVPANPYGFTTWFRSSVKATANLKDFADKVTERRHLSSTDRLAKFVKAAEQDDLPPLIPSRLDSQRVVALKLFKRFINLRYHDREMRKPPSIYFSKLAIDCKVASSGLTEQLEQLSAYVKAQMEAGIAAGSGPDEVNPTYRPDRLNDRWPTSQNDRATLTRDLDVFLAALRQARESSFVGIAKILSGLFGEEISKRATQAFLSRSDERDRKVNTRYEKGTGAIITQTTLTTPAVAKTTSAVPDHSFHCEIVDNDDEKDH